MPGLPNQSSLVGGIWSRHHDDITFDQLQKFWSELPPHARCELLRIDKQTLFEHVRKNLYCSRCNGLLLEGFSQIVMYGKSLQQEHLSRIGASDTMNDEYNDIQDPAVHPWGGLAATRDGVLTLLDCFIYAKSLEPLQNVFDSARARERERELLYPDACGGGGRGWISQGITSYGRGHGTRETCALHTARLSCDTLVDFWQALSDETQSSLLRMKEEDFIERLMYRFDDKRFCRDCRRNVIREFKELKELKRMRREPRCSIWFCVADTAFLYEVSGESVRADWHQSFADTMGTYHHFEWGIGTGEGKSDILDFVDVGMNGKVQADGLDLGGLSACYITLRAWKLDGRCTEICVKAHALKGQPCVHRRLVVGDGYVSITKGESIRSFFEHAEEAEEEEDDDATDKDGNDYDSDGPHPQKHAKSPELAREFLLDAATVIFKEQVEKAFREGTARQNAHSIFVSISLRLLEEHVHVACKEIVTLEKQSMLLEEEEKEKREEEERKERRRTKEREKKLRRKERIKGKERERERRQSESTFSSDSLIKVHDESQNSLDSGDSISDPGDVDQPATPSSPHNSNEDPANRCAETASMETGSSEYCCPFEDEIGHRDGNGLFIIEQSKSSRRKLRFNKESSLDQAYGWYENRRSNGYNEGGLYRDGYNRSSRGNLVKTNSRSCSIKFHERLHSQSCRARFDHHSCSCNQYKKDVNYVSAIRSAREIKIANRKDTSVDSRASFHSNGVSFKEKPVAGTGGFNAKRVWEPTSWRKCARSNSDSDISLRTFPTSNPLGEAKADHRSQQQLILVSEPENHCLSEFTDVLNVDEKNCDSHEDGKISSTTCLYPVSKPSDKKTSSCSSDNCSSCLSEGDTSTSSSSAHNGESSSSSDSEEVTQESNQRSDSTCKGNDKQNICDDASHIKQNTIGEGLSTCRKRTNFPVPISEGDSLVRDEPDRVVQTSDNGGIRFDVQHHVSPMPNECMHVPTFPSPPMGFHDQGLFAWPAPPASGYLPFPQNSHYFYPSPLGYGFMANQPSDFCMAVAPVPPHPAFSVQQPLYHSPASRTVLPNSKEQRYGEAHGEQQVNNVGEQVCTISSSDKLSLRRQQGASIPSVHQNGCAGNSEESCTDTSSFSLFHFGNPLAGAAGFCVNPVSLKEGTGGLPSASPAVPGASSCLKKEIEAAEYSLFATDNVSRFPILSMHL